MKSEVKNSAKTQQTIKATLKGGKWEVFAERVLYPAPDRAVDTEGDCGGVLPISFPYGPAAGGVGEVRMLVLPPIASSESTFKLGEKKMYSRIKLKVMIKHITTYKQQKHIVFHIKYT